MQLQNINQLKPEAARITTQIFVRAALRQDGSHTSQITVNVPALQCEPSEPKGHLRPEECLAGEPAEVYHELP